MSDRAEQGMPATVSNTWKSGSTLVDPGTTTVEVQRDDGTVLIAAGTATVGSGAAARTIDLTTAHTGLLDNLRLIWTTTNYGVKTTRVEVVGGFLFPIESLADIRTGAGATLGDQKTDQQLRDARTYAEETLEHEIRQAFVPRYDTWTFTQPYNRPTGLYQLPAWNVRTIRSVSYVRNGATTDYTVDQLADLRIMPGNFGYFPLGFSYGDIVTVRYEHGLDRPPAPVSEAALQLAKQYVVRGPLDERTVTQGSEQFTITASDTFGGNRAIQAVVDAYRQPLGV